MIVEGGILLSKEKASLPCSAIGGGFLTPATAYGRRLIEVLKPAGVTFEVLSCGNGPLPAARLREKGRNPLRAAADKGETAEGAPERRKRSASPAATTKLA